MPEMDGFTILEKMRENAKLRDIPVVVVSGGDLMPEQRRQLTEFGRRLVSKGSINEKDLLSIVERALKRVADLRSEHDKGNMKSHVVRREMS